MEIRALRACNLLLYGHNETTTETVAEMKKQMRWMEERLATFEEHMANSGKRMCDLCAYIGYEHVMKFCGWCGKWLCVPCSKVFCTDCGCCEDCMRIDEYTVAYCRKCRLCSICMDGCMCDESEHIALI